ncbi:ParB/RepB/Spo0J family partition protein [Bengtsoniella intestinalis]|uniref:ParB/RepB/Spo0J family partition protein n=1 Tax=Bengtsoniella intestinalis TaxID=3073143 RepID=UPI00391FBD3C
MAKSDLQSAMKKRASATAQTNDAFVDEVYEGVFGCASPNATAKRAMLPVSILHPFFTAKLGFLPYSEDDLDALAQDVEENGLIEEIIVRNHSQIPGEYEILSGHNRVNAHILKNLPHIPSRIEVADDARAVTIATVTNLQRRQGLRPSERGWAYRALLEAKKCQGKRGDLTSVEAQQKLTTRDIVAKLFGVSSYQVQRDIRLTYLIPEMLELVDNRKVKVNAGAKLSHYDTEIQKIFYEEVYQHPDRQLDETLLDHCLQTVPPANVDVDVLRRKFAILSKSNKSPSSLRIQRKKYEQYIPKSMSNQELEGLFLEFLKGRYGPAR